MDGARYSLNRLDAQLTPAPAPPPAATERNPQGPQSAHVAVQHECRGAPDIAIELTK